MRITALLYGILTAFGLTLALVFLTALAAYATHMSEGAAIIAAYASAVIAVFAGGLLAAVKAKRRVLLHSLCVSAVYAAALIGASVALNGKVGADVHSVSMLAGIGLTGFLAALLTLCSS